jgi:hypothetical protein
MKVMVMVKGTPADESVTPTTEMFEEVSAYNERLVKAGIMLDGAGLKPSAKGAQIVFGDGKTSVVDGPFTEAKEIIGGFWMLDVKSKEEAVEWAKRVPVTNTDFVELRQVFEMEDFPEDVQRAADNATVKAAVEKHSR